MTVVMVGRSDQRLRQARQRILGAVPDADLRLEHADLSLLGEVRELAKRLADQPAPDVVVSNAAVIAEIRDVTAEGPPADPCHQPPGAVPAAPLAGRTDRPAAGPFRGGGRLAERAAPRPGRPGRSRVRKRAWAGTGAELPALCGLRAHEEHERHVRLRAGPPPGGGEHHRQRCAPGHHQGDRARPGRLAWAAAGLQLRAGPLSVDAGPRRRCRHAGVAGHRGRGGWHQRALLRPTQAGHNRTPHHRHPTLRPPLGRERTPGRPSPGTVNAAVSPLTCTVERGAHALVRRLFDEVVAEDVLPKVLHRCGPIPAVVGTEWLTGPWSTSGSRDPGSPPAILTRPTAVGLTAAGWPSWCEARRGRRGRWGTGGWCGAAARWGGRCGTGPASLRSYRQQYRRPVDADLLEEVARWVSAYLQDREASARDRGDCAPHLVLPGRYGAGWLRGVTRTTGAGAYRRRRRLAICRPAHPTTKG